MQRPHDAMERLTANLKPPAEENRIELFLNRVNSLPLEVTLLLAGACALYCRLAEQKLYMIHLAVDIAVQRA